MLRRRRWIGYCDVKGVIIEAQRAGIVGVVGI